MHAMKPIRVYLCGVEHAHKNMHTLLHTHNAPILFCTKCSTNEWCLEYIFCVYTFIMSCWKGTKLNVDINHGVWLYRSCSSPQRLISFECLSVYQIKRAWRITKKQYTYIYIYNYCIIYTQRFFGKCNSSKYKISIFISVFNVAKR